MHRFIQVVHRGMHPADTRALFHELGFAQIWKCPARE